MKKLGFTLAEVLITIAILGVIAALTLPALLSNVEKHHLSTALKTNKSILERGFAQMLATNSADSLDATPLWTKIEKENPDDPNEDIEAKNKDNKIREMKKYFSVTKEAEGTSYDVVDMSNTKTTLLDNTNRFEIGNGAIYNITFKDATTNNRCNLYEKDICENYAEIYVDVNGQKRPNKIGRDIFYFILSKEGRLFPYGCSALNGFLSGAPLWDSAEGCQGNENKIKEGRTCTARLTENNFNMDY